MTLHRCVSSCSSLQPPNIASSTKPDPLRFQTTIDYILHMSESTESSPVWVYVVHSFKWHGECYSELDDLGEYEESEVENDDPHAQDRYHYKQRRLQFFKDAALARGEEVGSEYDYEEPEKELKGENDYPPLNRMQKQVDDMLGGKFYDIGSEETIIGVFERLVDANTKATKFLDLQGSFGYHQAPKDYYEFDAEGCLVMDNYPPTSAEEENDYSCRVSVRRYELHAASSATLPAVVDLTDSAVYIVKSLFKMDDQADTFDYVFNGIHGVYESKEDANREAIILLEKSYRASIVDAVNRALSSGIPEPAMSKREKWNQKCESMGDKSPFLIDVEEVLLCKAPEPEIIVIESDEEEIGPSRMELKRPTKSKKRSIHDVATPAKGPSGKRHNASISEELDAPFFSSQTILAYDLVISSTHSNDHGSHYNRVRVFRKGVDRRRFLNKKAAIKAFINDVLHSKMPKTEEELEELYEEHGVYVNPDGLPSLSDDENSSN
ncbi:hypothetical protein BJ508DRAFT_63052 [Ascobolus immersus RN42]|uniref:Uncharacterized protein n=1 Tax=Ascobolus immersus RN42 TaxID=1160509 RepID=A0A3N4ISB9_ASCIM|nr:hypothetical protein BJ508DRAFT_63052 [Ascobolus immersus RN42]